MKKTEESSKDAPFKQQLFQSFQEAGLLDSLKTKMRSELLGKLKPVDDKENQDISNLIGEGRPKPLAFQIRLMNTVVENYLKTQNYNYSYSVFSTEAKISSSGLSKEEILDYFSKNSKLYKNMKRKEIFESSSLLEGILELIYDCSLCKDFVNRSAQTEGEEKSQSIDGKLQNIDENFLNQMNFYKLSTISNAEEQMNSYKRNIESRFQIDLKNEIEKVKEYEVANVKFEESQKYQAKLAQFKKEQEKKYLENIRRVKEREENVLKFCKAKIAELEKKEYENRQTVLSEMEKLKKKELELARHNCLDNQELLNQKNRLIAAEEDLKRKIKEYESAREELQKKMIGDIQQRKFELTNEKEKKALSNLQKELEREREFLKQNAEALKTFEIQREYLAKENQYLQTENKELEVLRTSHQETINSLRNSINSLKTQIDSQYNVIAEKNTEIEKLRFSILEKDSSIRSLQELVDKLSSQSLESLKSYESAMEKYRALMQKRKREVKAQSLVKKEDEFFVIEEDQGTDLLKKKEFKRNADEFFNKIKEIRKERTFLMDFQDDDDQSLIKETGFLETQIKEVELKEKIYETNDKAIGLEIDELRKKKEEYQFTSQLAMKKPEKVPEKPQFFRDDVQLGDEEPDFGFNKKEKHDEKPSSNVFNTSKSNKPVDKKPDFGFNKKEKHDEKASLLNTIKSNKLEEKPKPAIIETKKEPVNQNQLFPFSATSLVRKEKKPSFETESEINKSLSATVKPLSQKEKMDPTPSLKPQLAALRPQFQENTSSTPEIKTTLVPLPEKHKSQEKFSQSPRKEEFDFLNPKQLIERPKSFSMFEEQHEKDENPVVEKKNLAPLQKPVGESKRLEQKSPDLVKNISVPEKKSPFEQPNTNLKPPEKSISSGFLQDQKDPILQKPPQTQTINIKPQEQKSFEKEKESLKLNFFDAPPPNQKNLSSLGNPKPPESKPTETLKPITFPNKSQSKLPSLFTPASNEKTEGATASMKIEPPKPASNLKTIEKKNNEFDEFDDLLGELDFLSAPVKKEVGTKTIEKPPAQEIKQNEKTPHTKAKEIDKMSEPQKKTEVPKKETKKEELSEEIEEDIDFGEIDEEDLFE